MKCASIFQRCILEYFCICLLISVLLCRFFFMQQISFGAAPQIEPFLWHVRLILSFNVALYCCEQLRIFPLHHCAVLNSASSIYMLLSLKSTKYDAFLINILSISAWFFYPLFLLPHLWCLSYLSLTLCLPFFF